MFPNNISLPKQQIYIDKKIKLWNNFPKMLAGKYIFFLCLFFLLPFASSAEVASLDIALRATYTACINIDDNLHDLKVLAGVNTAVTSVGTGLGVGATVTGFVKASTDNKIEALEKELDKMLASNPSPLMTEEEKSAFLSNFREYLSKDLADDIDAKKTEIQELTDKSKKLGNWRTGLLAGNTATNIVGAIISKTTINKGDIQSQIDACILATKNLGDAIIAAKMNGEDVSEAQKIYSACREYEYVDITPITKRGKGVMISSSIGAVLGGAGTITSGIANSEKIRDDNTDTGKKKEKDLNTASNVLSIGATAASATATVFNATQIAAVKKVAKVSEECTGVLK